MSPGAPACFPGAWVLSGDTWWWWTHLSEMDQEENWKPWPQGTVFPDILVCAKPSVVWRGIAHSLWRQLVRPGVLPHPGSAGFYNGACYPVPRCPGSPLFRWMLVTLQKWDVLPAHSPDPPLWSSVWIVSLQKNKEYSTVVTSPSAACRNSWPSLLLPEEGRLQLPAGLQGGRQGRAAPRLFSSSCDGLETPKILPKILLWVTLGPCVPGGTAAPWGSAVPGPRIKGSSVPCLL